MPDALAAALRPALIERRVPMPLLAEYRHLHLELRRDASRSAAAAIAALIDPPRAGSCVLITLRRALTPRVSAPHDARRDERRMLTPIEPTSRRMRGRRVFALLAFAVLVALGPMTEHTWPERLFTLVLVALSVLAILFATARVAFALLVPTLVFGAIEIAGTLKFVYLQTPLLAPDLEYFINRDTIDVIARYPAAGVSVAAADPDSAAADPCVRRRAALAAALSLASGEGGRTRARRARGRRAAVRFADPGRPVRARLQQADVDHDQRPELSHRLLHVVQRHRDHATRDPRKNRPQDELEARTAAAGACDETRCRRDSRRIDVRSRILKVCTIPSASERCSTPTRRRARAACSPCIRSAAARGRASSRC